MENSDSVSVCNTIYSPPSQGEVGGGSSPLPLYYREISYPGDTTYYTRHDGPSYGVAGDPIPYTIRGDSLLMLLLILCFVFLTVSMVQSRRFIGRQFKNIFYIPRNDHNISETSVELRFQLFLMALSCLLMAIATQQFVIHYVTTPFIFDNELTLIAIFFGVYSGYQLFRGLIYTLVNSVFFDNRQNRLWMKIQLFIAALEGVILFPVILLIAFLDFPLENAAYFLICILLLAKILTFYKCWSIFFRQNGVFFQTFLYFCTLEVVPLLSLAAGTMVLIDKLKFIF